MVNNPILSSFWNPKPNSHEDMETSEKQQATAATHLPPSDRKTDDHSTDDSDETFTPAAQIGVKKIEAITTVWTKTSLVTAYAMIWFIYLITSLQEVTIRAFNPYVTSAFSLHSLTAATSIVASIVGGLLKLPLAKILDTWGRPQGLSLMLFIWTIGFIMMAGCNNVQTYAAAQVFSSVGSQGVSYCVTIFIADTTHLKNRALMLAFATSPYIITTWLGGPISESFLNGAGWRWGIGIFAILVPFVVSPLCFLFLWNDRKAKKTGLIPSGSTRPTLANVKQYLIDIDAFGILILAGGMALFLLSFSLYSYQADQWRSPMIICMLVFGILLLLAFVLWEKFGAPVTFIPFELLLDRTVFSAGVMFFFVFFNSAVWGSYFSSMLQVVFGLTVTQASYVNAIYRVGSCFWTLFVGVLIRWTGRFKWLALYFAVPLMMLGVGLMIKFRQPDADIGYVCMTQVFVAFAGGTIVICGELAMMAPSDHQHIAVIIAVLDLFCSIGNAVGSAVAAAIWTGTFPQALERHVPQGTDIASIYADITTQMSYEKGTPTRSGIDQAYGDSQRIMLITSVCALVGALASVAVWRDIKLKDFKQVKGIVV